MAFFSFLEMAFMSKAAQTKIISFSGSSSCMVAYLDQNLQCMKRLHYTTKGQTFNGVQKIKRFHNLLCFGSLVSKWQKTTTFSKNKPTNKQILTNLCVISDKIFARHSILITLPFYLQNLLIRHATFALETNFPFIIN